MIIPTVMSQVIHYHAVHCMKAIRLKGELNLEKYMA